MSLAALATGLVLSLGTDWGLLRHYWVSVKFLLTILITMVLQVAPIHGRGGGGETRIRDCARNIARGRRGRPSWDPTRERCWPRLTDVAHDHDTVVPRRNRCDRGGFVVQHSTSVVVLTVTDDVPTPAVPRRPRARVLLPSDNAVFWVRQLPVGCEKPCWFGRSITFSWVGLF